MPSVAMNGGMRTTLTRRPVISPSAPPTARQTSSPSAGSAPPWTMLAVISVARARIDPTDRSMPRVRMTIIMPTEMMPLMADWRRMFSRLSAVRKRSEASVSAAQSNRNTSSSP